MKKKYTFLLLIFSNVLSFAQIGKMTTSERILEMNTIQKIKTNKEEINVISEIPGYVKSSTIFLSTFLLNNITLPGNHKKICGPTLKGEIEIDTEQNQFIKNLQIKDKEVFFYRQKSYKTPFSLIYQMIDKDGIIRNGSIEIPNVEDFKLVDNYGYIKPINPLRLELVVSKDEESIYVIYSQDQSKTTGESDKIEHTIITIDTKSMLIKGQSNYSLNFDLISAGLVADNNNYLYTLIQIEKPDTVKKLFNYNWIRNYKVIGLNTSIKIEPDIFDIELENKRINDVNFDFANNGDLIIAGLFTKPIGNKYQNENVHGYFTKRIDTKTKRIIWENETLFSSEIVTATKGALSAKLGLGTSENFYLMDLAFLKNGSICIIMEDRFYGSDSYSNFNYLMPFSARGNYLSAANYGNKTTPSIYSSIIVGNIDKDGKTIWTKHIPKKQERNPKHNNDKAIGYSFHVIDNKIQFVFTDTKGNYDPNTFLRKAADADGSFSIKSAGFKSNTLAMFEIDEQGESKQRVIAADYGYSFLSKGITWTENNDEILVVSVKGWYKYSVSKIKL